MNLVSLIIASIGLVISAIYLSFEYAEYGSRLLDHVRELPIEHAVIFSTIPIFALLGYLLDKKLVLEEKLRALSEEKYLGLMENASAAIFVLDSKGGIADANKRAEALTGYAKSSLLGMSFEELYPKEQLALLAENFQHALQRGSCASEDFSMVRKDGSLAPVRISAGAVEHMGEKLVMCIAEDITERRQVESELRASEERYRKLVEFFTVWNRHWRGGQGRFPEQCRGENSRRRKPRRTDWKAHNRTRAS